MKHSIRFTVLLALATNATAQETLNWLRVTSPDGTAPPAVGGGVVTFDLASLQTVLLIDGETWLWDGVTWRDSGLSTAPTASTGFARTYDLARNRIVVFGGQVGRNGPLNETWEWDGRAWSRAITANAPSPRSYAAMAFDDVRREVVLFGGVDSNGLRLGDTWVYDGVDWVQRTPGGSPAARAQHSMIGLPSRGAMLFGGSTIFDPADDQTWIWDGADWTRIATTRAPSPRYSSDVAFDLTRNRALLLGGVTVPDPVSNPNIIVADDALWAFDGTDWSQVSVAGDVTAPLFKSITWDLTRDRLIAYDGIFPLSNTTWELEPANAGDARVFSFGVECATVTDGPSLDVVSDTRPRLDSLFEMRLRNVPLQPGFAFLGLSTTETPPTPLTAIGVAPFCQARIPFDVGVFVPAPNGDASLALPIPADPTFTGFTFFAQGLTIEAAPQNALAAGLLSNALAVTLGR